MSTTQLPDSPPWIQPSTLSDPTRHPSPAVPLDLSVIIPTYNGAARLPKLLNALACQQDTAALNWEILVCDNNSTDATAAVVRYYQAHQPPSIPLSYCHITQPGAAPTRQHGVEQARGHLIAFLDDDNIPAPDWVASAYAFAQSHPHVGAFGSRIQADFEQPLPPDLIPLQSFLAIIDRGNQPYPYLRQHKILPPGAGLVVRRQAWISSVPDQLFLNHQGRDAGLASEDLEALIYLQQHGWPIWYVPSMRIQHHIPAWRLQRPAILDLLRCVGQSRYYIRLLRHPHWQWPLWLLLHLSLDLIRLGQHYLHHPQPKSQLPLGIACQRQYLHSTLRSPSFLARKVWRDKWSKASSSPSLRSCP